MNGYSFYQSYRNVSDLTGRDIPPRWEDLSLSDRTFWETVANHYQDLGVPESKEARSERLRQQRVRTGNKRRGIDKRLLKLDD